MVSSGSIVTRSVLMMSLRRTHPSVSLSPPEPRGGLTSLRSRSETSPTRRPASTTGRCLIPSSWQTLQASAALASGPSVTTSRVMESLTRSISTLLYKRPASDQLTTRPEPGIGLTPLTPDALCGLGDGAELVLLVLDAEGIADDRGREPALRAQGQPLERHEAGGLPDAGLQFLRGLAPTRFRGHEAEDGDLVVGHVGERLEAAGALVVVLEHQPLGADTAEDPARQRLIGAGDQPAATLIAPAEVEGEGDAGVFPDYVII